MTEIGVAEVVRQGQGQIVRLPDSFRLDGDRVRVRRVAGGLLLEPVGSDVDARFSELDRFVEVPFMEDGRDQPAMPEPNPSFE